MDFYISSSLLPHTLFAHLTFISLLLFFETFIPVCGMPSTTYKAEKSLTCLLPLWGTPWVLFAAASRIRTPLHTTELFLLRAW